MGSCISKVSECCETCAKECFAEEEDDYSKPRPRPEEQEQDEEDGDNNDNDNNDNNDSDREGSIHFPIPPTYLEDENLNILKVERISLDIKENGKAHHTEKYDLMRNTKNLVLRRGQEFYIDVYFNRSFDKIRDGISFVFTFDDNNVSKASIAHGTLIVTPLLTKSYYGSQDHSWTSFIEEIDHDLNKVRVQFKSPSNCAVGKYKLAIDTKLKEGEEAISYPFKEPIYIIFNPWNTNDPVYMENEDERNEYVMEDSGLIWRGVAAKMRRTIWSYAQFEKEVLDCAFEILSGPGKLKYKSRSDPIKVCRALSAAVNSVDDNGVLEGNWTDDFSKGIPPSKWTGSLKILEQYYKTKKPVKYGQCWVFSGVVVSLCKTLGIPVRVITNYSSAHDTQSSLTVDIFVDDNGKPIEKLNTDSVWNFHVWNEVWMERPDLGSVGYGGWQVIDATPQETSDNFFQCGPTSVSAVRRGEILKAFDAPFVFSEVNADKVYWHFRGSGKPIKLLGKKADAIGINISTKAINSFEREDITDTYKYPEKSAEERETMLSALRQAQSSFSRFYLNEEFNDIRFDLQLKDDIIIGSSFRVILNIDNVHSEKSFKIQANIRVDTMLYTGQLKSKVKYEVAEVEIGPETNDFIMMEITYEDYANKLSDQASFNVSCLAKVLESDFEYFVQDDFRVRMPDIRFVIENAESLQVGKEFTGTVILKNPLPVTLNRCRFIIDAPGFGDSIKIRIDSIQPDEEGQAEFSLTPLFSGKKTISAKFMSKELIDVDGFTSVIVEDDPTVENNEL